MNVCDRRNKISRTFRKMKEERIEYYFINMEKEKIKIWPVLEILEDYPFVYCLDLSSGKMLSINKKRIQWDVI